MSSALEGIHIPASEELKFSSVRFAVSDIGDVIRQLHSQREEEFEGRQYLEIHFENKEELVNSNDQILSLIHFRSSSSTLYKRTIEDQLLFEYIWTEELSIEEIIAKIQILQYFTSLFTDNPSFKEAIYFSYKLSEPSQKSVNLYFHYPCNWLSGTETGLKNISRHKRFFPFRSFLKTPAISKSLNLWYDNYSRLFSSIVLYNSSVYNPFLFFESRFLNVLFSLEALERSISPCKYLSEEKHSNRIESILDSIRYGKDRNWLEGKLKYSNEYSLPKLLKETVKDLNRKFPFLNDYVMNADEFAGKVATIRNSLAHPKDKTIDNFTGIVQTSIFEQLKLIWQLRFFSILELPEAEIKEYIEINYQYLIEGINFVEFK